jgi:hypothetical protein
MQGKIRVADFVHQLQAAVSRLIFSLARHLKESWLVKLFLNKAC